MNALLTSSAPLLFSFENAQQQPVIYITNDPALNVLSFTVLNNTLNPISLHGGTPIPETQQGAGKPSCLYLSPQDLVTEAEFEAVTITAPGWQSTWFPSEKQWGLTPSSDISLAPQGSITFTLRKLIADERPGSGFLNVDYWNMGSIAPGNDQIKVFLQNPPSRERKDLKLALGFNNSNAVLISDDIQNPISNALEIILSNPNQTQPVVPPNTPWEDKPPVFILSFVYGDKPGYGALSTAAQAANIVPAALESNGSNWEVVPDLEGSNPSWQIQPKDHNILGTGEAATASFTIDNIVTYLQPGPTLLYLQYANIPGYNDGFLSLVIEKEKPVKIGKFYTETSWRLASSPRAPVTLHWEVSNAFTLKIESGFGSFNVSGKSSWTTPGPVTKSMRFTLTATAESGHFVVANTDFEIIGFTVVPNLASQFRPFGYQTTAYSQKWNRVYFTEPRGKFFSLDTQSNQVLEPTKLPAEYFTDMASSPSASADMDRIYIADPNANSILVIDVDFQGKPTLTRTLKTPEYSGSAVAVTHDGQTVYFDGGTQGIGYFNITDYKLHYFAKWKLPSIDIRSLLISPDGTTLYVTSGGNYVVGFDIPNHTFLGKVKLGDDNGNFYASAMTITADSQQIYVAYIGGVVVIFPHKNWRTEFIPHTTSPQTTIVNVIASPSSNIVFALIQSTDALQVIDTESRKVIGAVSMVVPQPDNAGLAGAAMSPDGSKLYLTDNSDNTFVVALLEIDVVGKLPEAVESACQETMPKEIELE